MNEKAQNEVIDSAGIDIRELWHIFWSRKFLIAACALIGMLLAYVKVTYFTSDVYSSDGLLYISNLNYSYFASKNPDMSGDYLGSYDEAVLGSDLETSMKMCVTYAELLTQRSFLDTVRQGLDEDKQELYDWKTLQNMITSSVPKEDTWLIEVSVTGGVEEDVYQITNVLLDTAVSRLEEVGGQVVIWNDAAEPTLHSRGMLRSLLISCIAGLLIGCAIAFLMDFFDNRIRRSEDITKRYKISVLGEISR